MSTTQAVRRAETPSSPLAFYRGSGEGAPSRLTGKPPLVLGDSLGSDRHMWDWVLPHLPADLQLIFWEQPGHGRSRTLEAESPSAADTVAAVKAGLDDLGVQRAFFAGLSLGGLVTLAYAEQHSTQVAAFMVLDSGAVTGEPAPWLEKADQVESDGLDFLVEGTMERWFTSAFADGPGKEAVQKIREIFLSTDPAGYAQCCRILANTNLVGDLHRALAPGYVLTGDEDAGVSPQVATELLEALPDPGGLVIVPASKHLTAVQDPQLVAASLVDMVRAHD